MGRRRGYKRYSAEFKREALKRASEDGMTDSSYAQGKSPHIYIFLIFQYN